MIYKSKSRQPRSTAVVFEDYVHCYVKVPTVHRFYKTVDGKGKPGKLGNHPVVFSETDEFKAWYI